MGFIKLEFPILDPIWGIETPCPKFLGMDNIGGGFLL